jgi:2'-5' RNA ligase
MRLFVAVELSPDAVAAALDLVEVLRARASRLAPHSRISWVAAERLHVTIRFVGHVEDDKAAAIAEALVPAIGVEPFDLTIAGVGVFPSKGPPRVVWAGLSSGRDRLSAIERLVSDRLSPFGVAPEDRPFNPHLTLGRVREAGGLRSPALLEGLDQTALGWTRVDAITLFESRLSPKGPTYRAIHRSQI